MCCTTQRFNPAVRDDVRLKCQNVNSMGRSWAALKPALTILLEVPRAE